jgi:hypothetical protein
VIDSGDPRNWETRGINGFLGHQGIRSPELRKIGRAECGEYGVEFLSGIVDTALNETGELFAVQLRDETVIESRRILLAIGIRDVWPDIPGLGDCYGETVHVCPDCDGYETRDKKTVVIGAGRKACGMAFALATCLGLWAAPDIAPVVAVVALVAMAATWIGNALRIGPHGAYMFALACAAATSMPAGHLTPLTAGLLRPVQGRLRALHRWRALVRDDALECEPDANGEIRARAALCSHPASECALRCHTCGG